MTTRITVAKATASVLVPLVVMAASVAAGIRIGERYQANVYCCAIESRMRNLVLSTKEVFRLQKFYSQTGQDKWVTHIVFPGVRNGFFVDIGSGDGTHNSNTKALENLGWTGVCIDPFPKHMEDRTCQMFRNVVYSTSGQHVLFQVPPGGLADEGGSGWIAEHRSPNMQSIEFVTVSLADILERAKAPRFIHYISMDIEGAELAALRGFPFDKHQVGAWTIEHNYSEPRRSEIRALLLSHGYERAHSWLQDDYYVRAKRQTSTE